jgi:hypothetical protein
MCIAIISEHGVPLPARNILKRCWKNNHDGAGFAYLTKSGEWSVQKGLQTWKAFIEKFESYNFLPENMVIIHFRVGTSGKKNPNGTCFSGCTHPFPVADNNDALMEEEYIAKNIVFHNGVHSRPTGDLSDTQLAVRDIVDPLLPYIEDKKIQTLLAELLDSTKKKGSRWCITSGQKFYLFGKWITEKKTGLLYSNEGYKPQTKKWEQWQKDKADKRAKAALDAWLLGTGIEKKGTVIQPGREAFEFCAGGHWSWEKWEKDQWGDKDVQVETVTKDKVEDPNEITEIFDMEGNVIALVDRHGDILWDEDNGGNQHEPQKHVCPECTGDFFPEELNDGFCPWCHTQLIDNEWEAEDVECPHCGEQKFLIESSFDLGDTECVRCGALFVDTLVGPEAIVGWNETTKADRDIYIKAVSGMDDDALNKLIEQQGKN